MSPSSGDEVSFPFRKGCSSEDIVSHVANLRTVRESASVGLVFNVIATEF